MAGSITGEKLKRYKDLTLFLIKHVNNDLVTAASDDIQTDESPEANGNPEEFAKDLEALGPTFIKIGQLLSTRPDFLPPAYLSALAKLQDKVEPFSFEEVEEIITNELGVRISKAFAEFNAEPIAAASLGQVHKAVTRDGRNVAVKIQRPNIRETIVNDLEALDDIAATVDKHTETGRKYEFREMLKEFRNTLLNELDYKLEAQNLKRLHENLKNYESIIIPLPVEGYTTSKVLTMDYVHGKKITALTPLAQIEIDGAYLAEELFKAYLDQVLVHGFFHADPHPGNVFLTDDKRIALIDLGMTARIEPALQEELIKLMLYVSEGRGYEAAGLSIEISTALEHADREKFIKDVSQFVTLARDAKLGQIQLGKVVVQLTRIAADNGFRASPELTMLGKTLLNLDEIGKTLEPDFNPNAAIRRHTESIVRRHLLRNVSPGNVFSSLLETKELVQKLPVKLNRIVDKLASGEFTVKADMIDENLLTENFQKVANRITLGLVLAALIIGAAMLMRVESTFTILGYPGLAMILFLFAAACGFGLVFSILFKDRHFRK